MGISKEMMELPASALRIDPRVQRPMDPRRVAKIASEWNDLYVGTITVSHRVAAIPGDVLESGQPEEFVILDGQTRWFALKEVCGQDTTTCTMSAEVYTGLTLQEEAGMFLRLNFRKGVSPLDTFRLALVAGEEWAEGIRDIAAKYRWAVAGTGNGKQRPFQAIGAARKIQDFDPSGKTLDRVFSVIDAAWPKDPGTVCGETLHGIGGLYSHHSGLDTTGFVVKLAKIGFNKYYSSVHDTYRAHPSMSLAQASYLRTVEIYNLNRKLTSGRRIEL